MLMPDKHSLIKPLLLAINRQIEAKTPAVKLCEELEDKIISINIKNTSHHFDVIIKSKEFQLHPIPNEYHVKISGSLLSFVNLARKDSKDAIIDGSINFDGDVGVGQKYQKLIGLLKPDIEEELSHFVGDIMANNFSSFARATKRWAINSKNTFDENIAEYLQEEIRIIPNKLEFNNFSKKISELRDDVERIEIRIKNSLNSR
jgi:ubiquinone biosynthesis protein UbiJ